MSTGIVFDIQSYAVHDGPGIRTLVFLKGCPLACLWCCNPESQAVVLDLRYESSRCLRCLSCVKACPGDAVEVVNGAPRIHRDLCAACLDASCTSACPGSALVRVGREMSAKAVVDEVIKDAAFFRNSGGGVTFSGGEPFAQPEFLRSMLQESKANDLHTAVETCGYLRLSDLETAEPLVDLFLFDLKVMDPIRHRSLTGRSNKLILQNLAWLATRVPSKVIIRHAVIPGYNDDPENHSALADLMLGLGLKRLDLEPYHPLGEPKYEALGLSCPCLPDPCVMDETRMKKLIEYFTHQGLVCEVS